MLGVSYVLSLFHSKEDLLPLVEYYKKKIFEVKLKDMKTALTTQISEEADMSEVLETVKLHIKDANLPDIEVVRILWDVLMDAVQWSGKNQQQNANSALRQVIHNLCLMWECLTRKSAVFVPPQYMPGFNCLRGKMMVI